MVVKISYFIIFGIITIITGKPARYDTEDPHFTYVRNEYELQKLLQSLANQDTYDVASNQRGDRPNPYHENRAGSSRFDDKTHPLYYHNDKVDSPQYYESRENAIENQPSMNSLQIINQLLQKNDDKPGYDNGQNLLEDLLSLNRNNKFKLLKPNDETDNVDEVVVFLRDLQKKIADDRNNRDDYVYGKASGDKGSKLYLGEIDKQEVSDQVKSVLVQPKDGVMKLVENIVGFKPRYHNPADYVSVIDSYSDRDNLRCSGKNCARTNKSVNNNNNNRLRCRGKNCARTRYDDDDIKYNSKLSAKKVKLNDELDAIVLELSDAEHLLTKLNAPKQSRTNQLRGAKLLENVDLENLFNSRSSVNNKGNVEAVVFDLTRVENGDAVARKIKQLLSQNDEGSYDEYEDYGNLVEEHLKQGVYNIGKQVGTGRSNSNILPHKENNNNVYFPQWLLDEVIARSNGEEQPVKKPKSLFPLTRQQKERIEARKNQNTPRIYRRNFEQDVGVPFHLEVQGLGQVNP